MPNETNQYAEIAREVINRSMNDPRGSYADRLPVNIAVAISTAADQRERETWDKAINVVREVQVGQTYPDGYPEDVNAEIFRSDIIQSLGSHAGALVGDEIS